jgi:hypothetical protein
VDPITCLSAYIYYINKNTAAPSDLISSLNKSPAAVARCLLSPIAGHLESTKQVQYEGIKDLQHNPSQTILTTESTSNLYPKCDPAKSKPSRTMDLSGNKVCPLRSQVQKGKIMINQVDLGR